MYVCMFVYGLFGLRFIISMSCGGALSAPPRPLWLFAIFIGILSGNLCGAWRARGRGAIYVMIYRLLSHADYYPQPLRLSKYLLQHIFYNTWTSHCYDHFNVMWNFKGL